MGDWHPRPPKVPLTPELETEVVRRIQWGHGRNQIARDTGLRRATVTAIAQRHFLAFENTPWHAIEPAKIDADWRRANRNAQLEAEYDQALQEGRERAMRKIGILQADLYRKR